MAKVASKNAKVKDLKAAAEAKKLDQSDQSCTQP
jgi:hypothetical protein